MHKTILLLLLSAVGFVSCKNIKNEVDKIVIAKQFYSMLNNSDTSKVDDLIATEFTTIDDGFKQSYSKVDYKDWLKWDAVFKPKYEVIEIVEENDVVKVKVSKQDKRITFLHEDPIVNDEIIRFKGNKISSIERRSVNFNVPKFTKNVDSLVSWVDKNHPELKGFLHDQTEAGGKKYLKAIEYYKNENN